MEGRDTEAVAGTAGAAAAASPGRLLVRVDREIAAVNAELRVSGASASYRRAWRQFVRAWRDFFAEHAVRPSAAALRRALMFRRRAQQWRHAWQLHADGAVGTAGWDPEVGGFVVTPGAIKAEMDTVQAGITQLDADIMSSSVRQAFKTAWRGFVAEWAAFYKANQGWFARTWGKTYDKTRDYRRRADEWRAAFMREGGAATGPALVPPPEQGGSSWKAALLAGGALLLAGAVLGKAATR